MSHLVLINRFFKVRDKKLCDFRGWFEFLCMLFLCEIDYFVVLRSWCKLLKIDCCSFGKYRSLCFELLILFLYSLNNIFHPNHFKIDLVKSVSQFKEKFLTFTFGMFHIIHNRSKSCNLFYLLIDSLRLFLDFFFILIS